MKAGRLAAVALIVLLGMPYAASAQGVTGKVAFVVGEEPPGCPLDYDLWVHEEGQRPRLLLENPQQERCTIQGYFFPDWSPDGSMILVKRAIHIGGGRLDVELLLVDLRGGERVLSHTSGAVTEVEGVARWSPRGDAVAVLSGGCAGIQLIPLTGGARSCLDAPVDVESFGLAWSPDGREVAYLAQGGSSIRARATDSSGDRLLATAPSGRSFTGGVDWSPDGLELAAQLQANLGRARPVLVETTAGKVREVALEQGTAEVVSWTGDGRQVLFGRLAVDPITGRYEDSGLPGRAGHIAAYGPAFLAPNAQAPAAAAQVPVGGAAASAATQPGASPPRVAKHSRFSYAVSVVEPDEVPLTPSALAVSLLIVLALLLVIFPAHLFNATFEKNYDRIVAPFARRSRADSQPTNAWVGFGVVIIATAFLGGLLDPSFGADRASLIAVAGTALAVLFTSMACGAPGRAWISRRYHAPTKLQAYPASLVVAGATVAISRGLDFQPGYLYGIVGGFAVIAKPSKEDAGRSAALGAVVTMAIALVAWAARIPVADRITDDDGLLLGIIDTALAAVFAAGFSSLVFAMVPLRFLPGERILRWRPLVWAALFGIGAYALVHAVMTPVAGARKAATTAVVLFVAFGAVSVLFWAWFRFRPAPVADADTDADAVAPDVAPPSITLPDGWDSMTVVQLRALLPDLDDAQLAALWDAEAAGRGRSTLLDAIERRRRARPRPTTKEPRTPRS